MCWLILDAADLAEFDMRGEQLEFHLLVHVALLPVAFVLHELAVAYLVGHYHAVLGQIADGDVEGGDVLNAAACGRCHDGHDLALIERDFSRWRDAPLGAAYRVPSAP